MPTTSQKLGNNLVDNGTDLFYKGVAIPLVINLGGVRFVSKNGNDATGTIGRQDRPYLTVQAAIAASANGDTIAVYPGTYNEKLNITPLANLTFHLYEAKITWDAASADPALYISTTRLSIYAFGTSSITRTNQTSGYAVECAGNATFNFRHLTITGNQGGLSNGVLAGGELYRCKVTATNGMALNAAYNGITCYHSKFVSASGSYVLQNSIPSSETNRYINCLFSGANTYSIRFSDQGLSIFDNCEIVNTLGKPIRAEVGNRLIFNNCKLKGVLYSEIIQAVTFARFKGCEFISTTNQAVYFYNASQNDYTTEFDSCKFIAHSSATYSLDNAFSGQNKINAFNCVGNKPFNNIMGVLTNNAIDANLKELV